jgi:hypothetical protein
VATDSSKKTNKKRRGRGAGSVFEREDGLWVGSVSLGYTEAGKRKRKTVCRATKREVLDELDRLRSEARVGNLPGDCMPGDDPQLAAALDKMLG